MSVRVMIFFIRSTTNTGEQDNPFSTIGVNAFRTRGLPFIMYAILPYEGDFVARKQKFTFSICS